MAGGEFGTLTTSAVQAGTVGKFGYRVSAGRDQNQQWDDPDALAFRSHKFNVHTRYELPHDANVQVSGGLTDINRFDGSVQSILTQSTEHTDGYASLGYQKGSFSISSFWRRVESTADNILHPALAPFQRITGNDGSPITVQPVNTYDVEAQHTVDLGASNALTYGVNYRNNSVSGNNIDNSDENRLGFYLEDMWEALEKLNVISGVRVDLHSAINPTYSPRLALVYKINPKQSLRASGSVAYRAPTLIDENLDIISTTTIPTGAPPPFDVFQQITNVRGSSDLDPEQIVSYEIGYQGWFLKGNRLRIRADLFFNHVSDLLLSGDFLNDRGSADIYGGETGFEFLATSWLTGYANYAYQEIGQTFSDNNSRRAAPQNKINAGLRGDWVDTHTNEGPSGEIGIHHVGGATYGISGGFTDLASSGLVSPNVIPNVNVGAYTLLNLRGAYQFKNNMELAVSVSNALNDEHNEHPLGDVIKSRVMGWLTVEF